MTCDLYSQLVWSGLVSQFHVCMCHHSHFCQQQTIHPTQVSTYNSYHNCSVSCQAKRGKKCKAEGSLLESKGNSHLSFGKDTGLALFHALGKILYNKRPQPGEDGDAEFTQGDAVQECILPHASHAMQMPSSSKQSEVADR